MMKTLLIAGFVGGVILLECLAAYCLIPSTAQLEAKAKAHASEAGEEKHGDDKHGEEQHGDSHGAGHAASVEVELGKYNITVHRPASDVTLRVNFLLIGTVDEHDHEAFATLFEKNQHRLRDKIIFEIRNCELSDLTDPGLGLIKRRILAKSNDLLGKPILQSVVFSEFAYTNL
jgi:flagellar FliL protein